MARFGSDRASRTRRRWETGSHRCCPLWQKRRERWARRRSEIAARWAEILGTASPAGDALPPLLVYEAEVVVASAARGVRVVPVSRFLTGPKQNALLPDELIVAVRLEPREMRQTFMKVGPRNAMVIAVVSLCLVVDREADEIRVSYGSAGPKPGLVRVGLGNVWELPDLVARDASPIDDVRGTAAYRIHALKVLVGRALKRCLT